MPAFTSDTDSLIDLGINLPPLCVSADRLAATLRTLADAGSPEALGGYASSALLQRYQGAVAAWLIEHCGLAEAPSPRIIACHGARSGLLLCLQRLLPEGGSVLCDALTYEGFKQLAAVLKLELQPLAIDAQGCTPEALDRVAQASGAKVWLAALSLQNPLGTVASQARRLALAEVARRHALWVVEDDVYAALLPPGSGLSPLAELLPQRCFQVGSVSKALAPGLAAGWVLAPEAEAEALRQRCYAQGLSPSPWSALALCALQESGAAQTMLEDVRAELSARHRLARGVLGAAALGAAASSPDRLPAPHLWLPLPAGRAETLQAELLHQGLRLTPAAAPLLQPAPAPGLRLCLGAASSQSQLKHALQRVKRALDADAAGSGH